MSEAPETPVCFRCEDCRHANTTNLGMPGFELRPTTFDSVTETWAHLIEYPGHHIGAYVQVSTLFSQTSDE